MITILDLADEVLVLILLKMEFQCIIRFKQVCKRLLDVVENSIEVQYKIDCGVYGMVDGNTHKYTVFERRERLKAMQDAWAKGTPSETFEVFDDYYTRIFGSICARLDGESTIHMYQIPSKFRNIPKREWSVYLSFAVHKFSIDHSQRLLIVLEKW
ncbi:hypothetical protein EIP86_009739 [Pleurotus ostreatoroseus]|nr:hypothetical protein EIP86_009739 [Pleurotus ostreatoroseus]